MDDFVYLCVDRNCTDLMSDCTGLFFKNPHRYPPVVMEDGIGNMEDVFEIHIDTHLSTMENGIGKMEDVF